MTEDIRRKRVYFRSVHRGSKETDLILGSYARNRLPAMTDAQLAEFEDFLEESDTDIWNWVAGTAAPPGERYRSLLTSLRKTYALWD